MNIIKLFLQALLVLLLLSTIMACGPYLRQPVKTSKARIGQTTPVTIDLKSLPMPQEKIVAAVYKFRDQTGQYKPSETNANWSTAVTQGATNILIKAMEESGWFIPIERENVSNLLNERKIIRSSRSQYQSGSTPNAQVLPPLLYAGVILEGGIISYDANVVTGGAGLRYFGAGGSGQYRQDRVTVYLRAVSTSSGKILKTIYTTKTILSQAFDGGLFRFVRFSRLLEAETGFTYNEPSEMAVIEAIEKAVHSLVVEGMIDGLWYVDEDESSVELIKSYQQEKANLVKTDIFGRDLNHRRKQIGLTLNSTVLQYNGDFPDPVPKAGFELGVNVSITNNLAVSMNYGTANVAAKNSFSTNVNYLEGNGIIRILPYDRISPYIQIGGGAIAESQNSRFDFTGGFFPKVNLGGGVEFLVNNNLGINWGIDHSFIMSDRLDRITQGLYNDSYWRMNVGVNFYFGKPLTSDRKFKLPKKRLSDF